MIFQIGDLVRFTNPGMPYFGTEGVVIDRVESMGTYNVQTRFGNFWRYDFELELKGQQNNENLQH